MYAINNLSPLRIDNSFKEKIKSQLGEGVFKKLERLAFIRAFWSFSGKSYKVIDLTKKQNALFEILVEKEKTSDGTKKSVCFFKGVVKVILAIASLGLIPLALLIANRQASKTFTVRFTEVSLKNSSISSSSLKEELDKQNSKLSNLMFATYKDRAASVIQTYKVDDLGVEMTVKMNGEPIKIPEGASFDGPKGARNSAIITLKIENPEKYSRNKLFSALRPFFGERFQGVIGGKFLRFDNLIIEENDKKMHFIKNNPFMKGDIFKDDLLDNVSCK